MVELIGKGFRMKGVKIVSFVIINKIVLFFLVRFSMFYFFIMFL